MVAEWFAEAEVRRTGAGGIVKDGNGNGMGEMGGGRNANGKK